MTRGAFTPAIPKGKAAENRRLDLIVELDDKYNLLMKMEVLPVAQLEDLYKRAFEVGLTTLAGKIKKELGIVDIGEKA